MSVFSENMAAVSDEFDYLFAETVAITPEGGAETSLTGRLGPEAVDEDVEDTRRRRKVTRTLSFPPDNGPDARFVGAVVELADGTQYRVEGVQSRTESKLVLKLARNVSAKARTDNFRA